ncbi:NmrA family NAD(P)-binding protein [Paenibacillus sp. WLX1005]|uniref:NmrA family NAD(P)-binding protein n=1 Tax=Paenibacillus sp. WLX1005 TaxID=3243766 RepID=UPI0039845DA2
MNKIMITGATGKLGGWTIDHLLNVKGIPAEQIIALVRNEQKAKPLAEKGIEIRVADYEDLNALKIAFQQVNKLLFISSLELDNAKRLDQNHNVVMAAKAAEVNHVIFVGVANPELKTYGLEDVDLATEHSILAVNLPFTFMRNGTYLDEIYPDLHAAVQHGELISPTNGKGFNYVLRKDLALANATVLTQKGHEGKIYELVRSELINFPQLATILSNVVNKEIPYKEASNHITIKKLIESGVKEAHAESLVNVFHKAIADGMFQNTTNDLEKLVGDQLTPLDQSIESLLK